jgi:hypothetical protein
MPMIANPGYSCLVMQNCDSHPKLTVHVGLCRGFQVNIACLFVQLSNLLALKSRLISTACAMYVADKYLRVLLPFFSTDPACQDKSGCRYSIVTIIVFCNTTILLQLIM